MGVNRYVCIYIYVHGYIYIGVGIYIFIDAKKASHGFEVQKYLAILSLLFSYFSPSPHAQILYIL